MPYAQVNDQKLYYEDTGGDGPAIVFSHGLLMDHSMFAPQVRALQDRYRCIVWDERAHGLSADHSGAAFSYYDSADDLAALLEHLGIDQAILAGMSQGGYLSLRCAVTHPDIVRALILIDTQAQTEDPDKTAGYQPMVESWATQGLSDEIAQTVAGIILGAGWSGSDEWIAKWRAWQAPDLMGAFGALVARDDISDKIEGINVPALVVHGDADVAITLARARDMAERLPQSLMVTIAGAGHAANLTHHEPVNEVIEQFLQSLD